MGGFLDAVSLLTRIPTRAGKDTARAVPWMPFVGALVGLAVAGVYAGMHAVATPILAASIAIAAGIVVTGALHEDGLADVADAFGAGEDRAHTVEILADPRHGTYGVLALVVSVTTRIGALVALDPWAAVLAAPAAHALARAGALGTMATMPAADSSTLGASYRPASIGGKAVAGVVVACAIGVAGLTLWAPAAIGIAAASAALFGALAMRALGGFNGDVLGAVEQGAEIGIFVLAACVRRSLVWWR